MSAISVVRTPRFGMQAADGPRRPVVLGLTLIELLVGVIIVGIVAAIGIGIYAGSQNNGPATAAAPAATASASAEPSVQTEWTKVFPNDSHDTTYKRCDGTTLLYEFSGSVAALADSPECR